MGRLVQLIESGWVVWLCWLGRLVGSAWLGRLALLVGSLGSAGGVAGCVANWFDQLVGSGWVPWLSWLSPLAQLVESLGSAG